MQLGSKISPEGDKGEPAVLLVFEMVWGAPSERGTF